MRDDDLDRLLRGDDADASAGPTPLAPPRRKPVRIAALLLCAAAIALVSLPVIIALSGDAPEMFLGIALGDPGLMF